MYLCGQSNNLKLRACCNAPSPLAGFFTSFWKMDEATGATRNDAIGTNHLTDYLSNADQVTGIIGKGVGTSNLGPRALYRAHNASLDPTGDFTVSAWFNGSSYAANAGIVAKYGGPGVAAPVTTADSFVLFTLTGSLNLGIVLDQPGAGLVFAAHPTLPTANAWNLAVATWNATTRQGSLSLNGGPLTLLVNNGLPMFSGSSTSAFQVGVHSLEMAGPGTGFFFVGSIDAVGWANGKLISDAQLAALWNGGAGYEP